MDCTTMNIKIDLIFSKSSKITIYDIQDLRSLMNSSKWHNNSIYDFLDSNDMEAFLTISSKNKEFKAFIHKIDIVHYFRYLDMILDLCSKNEFEAFIDVLNQEVKQMYIDDECIDFSSLICVWLYIEGNKKR